MARSDHHPTGYEFDRSLMVAGDPPEVRVRKRFLTAIAVSFVLTCCTSREVVPVALVDKPVDRNPMIHSRGTRIVDGEGKPIELRGVALEGWLHWTGMIHGGRFDSETTVLGRMEQLVGAAEAEAWRRKIYERFIQESDIARIRALGFNVVRVHINHRFFDDDRDEISAAYDERAWRILDRFLGWCEAHRVYAVLSLNSAPGGQGKLFVNDPERRSLNKLMGDARLWTDERNQLRTLELWRRVAKRYAERRIVAGYDILNEPDPPSDRALVDLYRRIITAIREVDPHHMVILGGGRRLGSDFAMFGGPISVNQAYGVHLYGPGREKALRELVPLAERHQVPIWVGEFGATSAKGTRETVELMESTPQVSGWVFWLWKRVPSPSPRLFRHLAAIRTTSEWDEVMDWVNRPRLLNNKPSREETLAAMETFLESVRVENLEIDPEMRSILTSGWR